MVRFVSQNKAEEWWIAQSRIDPAAFIEYLTGKKPAKHHRIWLASIFHPDRNFVNIIAARDSAKAQPLDALVLTPRGWVRMGDLQVGDQVMTPAGGATEVVGVYPQGVQDIYRVTFNDQTSTECTDDHLWSVRLMGEGELDAYKTMSLHAIRTQKTWLDRRGGARFHIPVTKPVAFSPQNLPIAPYLMGALLGGGSFADERDKANPLNSAVLIPAIYLLGSIEQRTALLQGLMDTDGDVHQSTLVFYTVSPQLRGDFISLVQSLGGITRSTTTVTSSTDKGQPSFKVSFKLPPEIPPFYLSRKRSVYSPDTKYPYSRGIMDIELIGQKPAQCIRVADAQELYITNDYIVTHNTTIVTYALLWYISVNPLSYNMLVSVSASQAETRLRMIRSIIAEDLRYRNVFPHIQVDTQMSSTQQEFSVKSTEGGLSYAGWRSWVSQKGSLKDPTLFVMGNGGGGLIGHRVNGMMVLDDIVDHNYLTVAAQQKVMQFINIILIPILMEGAKMISIGTRWMPDDIYQSFISNKSWHSIVIPAILHDSDGNAFSYWEEYWDLAKLQRKRDAMDDEVSFRTMYLCDPSANTANMFALEVFHRDLPKPLPTLSKLHICVDLAISTKARADWTVLIAMGRDANNNIYILDITRFRAETSNAVGNIANFYDRVNLTWGAQTATGRVNSVMFESVGFQAAYSVLLASIRPDIITHPVTLKGSKGDRAEVVAQWANLGRLFINQNIHEDTLKTLKAEWTNFPMHRHDDMLDAASLYFQGNSVTGYTATVETIRIDPDGLRDDLRARELRADKVSSPHELPSEVSRPESGDDFPDWVMRRVRNTPRLRFRDLT